MSKREFTDAQESALLAGITFAHGSKATLSSLHAKGLTEAPEKNPDSSASTSHRAKKTREGWAAEERIGRERSQRHAREVDRSRKDRQESKRRADARSPSGTSGFERELAIMRARQVGKRVV